MQEHTTSWYRNYTFLQTIVPIKFIRYNMVLLLFHFSSTVQNGVHLPDLILLPSALILCTLLGYACGIFLLFPDLLLMELMDPQWPFITSINSFYTASCV
jgi:hypothetical protein